MKALATPAICNSYNYIENENKHVGRIAGRILPLIKASPF
jgi:hypothetical protein